MLFLSLAHAREHTQVKALLATEVMAAERARRKYKDLRLEMSMAAFEHDESVKHQRSSAADDQVLVIHFFTNNGLFCW